MAFVGVTLLILLPGLLVARAPWTAVPALSLAFWALSLWWTPTTSSRAGVLVTALVVSLLLMGLRLLPKHEVPPPPGWTGSETAPAPPRPGLPPPAFSTPAARLVLLIALLLVAPAPLWRNAPGPRLAYQTTAARLVLWRDGLPVTSEPLLPLSSFGAHAPALGTLGADVARAGGLDPARGVLVVVLVGVALAVVGAFALFATRLPPLAAATAAVVSLAVFLAPLAVTEAWPEALGWGEAALGLAFLLPAAALLVGHGSRSSAFGAAWLVAAGALAQPALAALTLAVCGVIVLSRPRAGGRAAAGRLALVAGVALVLAAPALLRLVRALSAKETAAIAGGLPAVPSSGPILAVLLATLTSVLVGRLATRVATASPRAAVAVTLVAAGVLAGSVDAWIARGQLDERSRRVLERAGQEADPLEAICAPEALRDWVPALAGRAAAVPGWLPAVYRDEGEHAAARSCRDLGDIVSREAGKPLTGSDVLIDRRRGVTLPTR